MRFTTNSSNPPDPGYGQEVKARFGLVYEALDGGDGFGAWVVVDRWNGYSSAYRMMVDPAFGQRMNRERLDMIRTLFAAENARYAQRRAETAPQ
jgi:hypothetical protein